MDRRYPGRPLVGVGAILFTPCLDEVLLVQRGSPPSEGSWTFPGGLVEAGESLRAACLREIQEETGIAACLVDLAFVAGRVIRDAEDRVEYHYVIHDFWGIADRAVPTAGSDARQVSWVRLDGLKKIELTRGVPEAVERARDLAHGQLPRIPILDE